MRFFHPSLPELCTQPFQLLYNYPTWAGASTLYHSTFPLQGLHHPSFHKRARDGTFFLFTSPSHSPSSCIAPPSRAVSERGAARRFRIKRRSATQLFRGAERSGTASSTASLEKEAERRQPPVRDSFPAAGARWPGGRAGSRGRGGRAPTGSAGAGERRARVAGKAEVAVAARGSPQPGVETASGPGGLPGVTCAVRERGPPEYS